MSKPLAFRRSDARGSVVACGGVDMERTRRRTAPLHSVLGETGNFVMAQTCTYHDHLVALNPGLLGSIVIME